MFHTKPVLCVKLYMSASGDFMLLVFLHRDVKRLFNQANCLFNDCKVKVHGCHHNHAHELNSATDITMGSLLLSQYYRQLYLYLSTGNNHENRQLVHSCKNAPQPPASLQNKGGVLPEGLQISFYCLKPKQVKDNSHPNQQHWHCECPANRVLSSGPQRDRWPGYCVKS